MTVAKQVMTLDEYHAIIDAPENKNRILELIDGELVEKMPSFEPSQVAVTLSAELIFYLRQNPIGRVSGADGGYIMPDGSVLIPDVGYISKERMPEKPDREVPVPPDFAVEVKSPTDSKRELRLKVERYISQGTKLVWLVFPESKQVEVYTPNGGFLELSAEGELDGGNVLPGFRVRVSAIFPE